jgi:phosphate transport system permease protein
VSSPFHLTPRASRRRLLSRAFGAICLCSALIAVAALAVLLASLAIEGLPGLSWDFITRGWSSRPARAGLQGAIIGSGMLIALTALVIIPIGVAAAVYLEEFVTRRSRVSDFIEVNIANLSGVPSIVYGMLGLAVFTLGLGLGRTVIAGALTLGILVLPMVILVSREAMRAVPRTYVEGGMALGASRWTVIRTVVLPNSLPGILTGIILALSRALGETAPLIVVGAVTVFTGTPTLNSNYTALPITIFGWATHPNKDFKALAASGILFILIFLILVNGAAIALRARQEAKLRG